MMGAAVVLPRLREGADRRGSQLRRAAALTGALGAAEELPFLHFELSYYAHRLRHRTGLDRSSRCAWRAHSALL